MHARCRNLPYNRTMKGNKTKARSSPMEKTSESRHQRLFEENVRKIKKRSTNLKRRVRELFLRTGKVSAPHASVTRDGSL